ncbi:MAG TPA: MOSC domain-containing protein [Nitriliruptoraceae bacterium]|nr:MOSC domain-containing protein [Nitriliruptoraceae bacterium]
MTTDTIHLTAEQLETGLAGVRSSPSEDGTVAMIVARPAEDEREMLASGTFTIAGGLEGDDWHHRGSIDPDAQLTLINRAWLDHICAGDRSRWPLAGDQVVVDLDLSTANLVPGDRLRLGTALVEVTSKPHTGCKKFVARYGVEAQRLGATDVGKALRLRGIYVKVVEDGEATPGDTIRKVDTS